MSVIFLIPWRRGRKPTPSKRMAQPVRQQRNRPNLAGLGKGLIRWRTQTKSRISDRRQNTGSGRMINPANVGSGPRPAGQSSRGPGQADPGLLLADFFSEPQPLPASNGLNQYQTGAKTAVKERSADGFDLPESLAELGVAARRPGKSRVERFQTPAGRNFVARTEDATTQLTPPPDEAFDLGLDPLDKPYVSMFEDEPGVGSGGPATLADALRGQRPSSPAPYVVGASPFEDFGDDGERDDSEDTPTEALPPIEMVAEPTYDPNKRGIRGRGGPRRQRGIRFRNPGVALGAGLISALMVVAIVFLLVFISGSINKAPSGKYAVEFTPFGNGRTYGVFNDSQIWQHSLGDDFLANSGVANADVRYGNTIFKDAASASHQAQNDLTDVLVWGYRDDKSGRLVANLSLAPNGPFDPPTGRGRQLVERYLYDPDQMVFVTQAPKEGGVRQPLNALLSALSSYYNGNYDTALVGLSDLLMQNVPENEPGLRLLRGNVQFLLGKYTEAIEDYNQVININDAALRNSQPTPINPAYVHNNRAVALSFQGNYQEANKSFNTALSITDKQPKIFSNYAQFLLDHTDMEFRPALLNDWQVKLFNVLKLDPGSASANHYLGRIYYYLGNLDEAVNSQNRARELDPNFLEVYYWMGLAKLAKGQQEKQATNLNGALDVFRWGESRATTMESQNRQRWQSLNETGNQTLASVWDARAREANNQLDLMRFGIARSYLELTRLNGTDLGNPLDRVSRAVGGKKTPFEEAGPRLKDYLDRHPNDPDANFYYGQFLAVTGTGDPVPLYQQAKNLEKNVNKRFKYHQILADQYAANSQPDQAVAEYNEYIKLDPQNERGYLALSALQYRLARFKDAAASAEQAVRYAPSDPYAYLAAGAAQVGNLQFQQAVNYLDRALVLKPDLSEAHFQRGMALFRLNQRGEALNAFSRAITLDPTNPVAHFYSGIVYQENFNDSKSAINEWEKAVALDPKYDDAWIKLGLIYSQVNGLDKAINAYNKALSANDNDAVTHYYLGLLYEGQQGKDNLALAEKNYRRAVEINPGLVNAYYRLAIVLRQEGSNPDEALTLAQNAIKLDPRNAEAQAALGDIYRSRGEFDKALPTYNTALTLRKDYPEALFGRAATQLGLKQYDPALADISRALIIKTNWTDAYVLQGQIQIAKGQLDAANDSFATARRLDPNNASLLAEMGDLSQKQNNPDQAIKAYEDSLAINEANPSVHFKLGQLYLNRTSFDLAAHQFERVRQLDPNWTHINYWLGHTYAYLKRQDDAQKALEAMVKQEDSFIEAHYELGNVYRAKGQRDAAMTQYDTAIKLQPAFAPAWLNKAEILEEMVQLPQAVEAYRNAQNTNDQQIRDTATTALRRLGAK